MWTEIQFPSLLRVERNSDIVGRHPAGSAEDRSGGARGRRSGLGLASGGPFSATGRRHVGRQGGQGAVVVVVGGRLQLPPGRYGVDRRMSSHV